MPLCSLTEAFGGDFAESNTSKPFVTPLTNERAGNNYLEGFEAGRLPQAPEENDPYWYKNHNPIDETLPGSRYSNEGRTDAGYMDLGGLGGAPNKQLPEYVVPVGQSHKNPRLRYSQFKYKLQKFKDYVNELCDVVDAMEEEEHEKNNEKKESFYGYMSPRQRDELREPFFFSGSSNFMKDLPTFLMGGILVFLIIDVYLRMSRRR